MRIIKRDKLLAVKWQSGFLTTLLPVRQSAPTSGGNIFYTFDANG
ncbi:hypothetical protein [Nostoc sp.]